MIYAPLFTLFLPSSDVQTNERPGLLTLSWQDLTLIGAFLTAWDMSDNPGRVGLVIHALLVVAAVLGLLGLVLYMPFLAIMNMMNGTGGDG